jgi:hypothetical protein
MGVEFKIDKSIVRKYKLGEEPKDHIFWLAQTPEVRVAGIESLRLQYYGEAPFKQGFQRVYTITHQE